MRNEKMYLLIHKTDYNYNKAIAITLGLSLPPEQIIDLNKTCQAHPLFYLK